MSDLLFLDIIEIAGTVAFAISGIRLAAAKNFDWFGAYVVGLITAIGGGTLRDVLLALPVFWMQSGMYLAVTFLSLAAVILFRRFLVGGMRTLFIFDAIGLALFVVVGIEKTLAADYPAWVAIVMGIITGSFGGVTRDILINEEPLFFRKDIYATACLAGGLVYTLVLLLPSATPLAAQISCGITVIGLRIVAVYFGWSLPILHIDPEDLPPETVQPSDKTTDTNDKTHERTTT
ncbi:MAG: trimeric intracellular cation channel family protein [Muribaculaceae bacterium]|nr:trimeric intracellular cation channel family protein [Muribaculaceae bacterium]